jgi:hypothetical protein
VLHVGGLQKERAGHTRCCVLRGVIVPCNTGENSMLEGCRQPSFGLLAGLTGGTCNLCLDERGICTRGGNDRSRIGAIARCLGVQP